VSNNRISEDGRLRSRAGGLLAAIFVLVSLSVVMAACGTDDGDGGAATEESTGATNGLTAGMQAEKEIIENAIQTYFSRTGRSEIEPREKAGPIGPWHVVPFKGDIKGIRLPTRYHYAWDAAGNITAVVEAPAGEE
jgi:hypothetical protein